MEINNTTSSEINSETVQNLIKEAKSLFDVLDNTSDLIRKMEKSLTDQKAHFPFRLLISEEEKSREIKPKNTHCSAYPDVYYIAGYQTQICWYLSWELVDGNSKAYRLFLISEEMETIKYYANKHDNEPTFDKFQSTLIFKKPLIETELQTRLKYSQYLIPFVESFKNYLNNYRISIEKGKYPCADELLFNF